MFHACEIVYCTYKYSIITVSLHKYIAYMLHHIAPQMVVVQTYHIASDPKTYHIVGDS